VNGLDFTTLGLSRALVILLTRLSAITTLALLTLKLIVIKIKMSKLHDVIAALLMCAALLLACFL
jgi:hypothetical protein